MWLAASKLVVHLSYQCQVVLPPTELLGKAPPLKAFLAGVVIAIEAAKAVRCLSLVVEEYVVML